MNSTGMTNKLDVLVEDAEEDDEDQDENNTNQATSQNASSANHIHFQENEASLEKADSKHINLEKVASVEEDEDPDVQNQPLLPKEKKLMRLDKSSESNSS